MGRPDLTQVTQSPLQKSHIQEFFVDVDRSTSWKLARRAFVSQLLFPCARCDDFESMSSYLFLSSYIIFFYVTSTMWKAEARLRVGLLEFEMLRISCVCMFVCRWHCGQHRQDVRLNIHCIEECLPTVSFLPQDERK